MFMRLMQLKINPSFVKIFQDFYEETVIPELQKLPGCQFAELIQSNPHDNEFISMSFWESQKHAENFRKGSVYQKLFQKTKAYLAESTEWKLRLSDSLELEFKPVPEEPILKEYDVSTRAEETPQQATGLHVRLVSLKIQEGKPDEFKKIYDSEILPVLLATQGCLYVYLTENLQEKNEFISITTWASKEDAENYENSGQFSALVDRIKHTFSPIYRWKMAQLDDSVTKMKTSDDLSVSWFRMVSGKSFQKSSL